MDDRPIPTVLVVGELYVRYDPFAYEIHAEFNRQRNGKSTPPPLSGPRRPSWLPQSRVNPRES